MSPFKSIKGRALGKLLEGYKSSDIGKGFGSGGGDGATSITGGAVIPAAQNPDGYALHIFTSPDQFVISGGTVTVDLVLVGGGGGGGGRLGGGGGGGGYLYLQNKPYTDGSHAVEIGDGGAADPVTYPNNGQGDTHRGGNTTISDGQGGVYKAWGGGGGSADNGGSASFGASGGGGCGNSGGSGVPGLSPTTPAPVINGQFPGESHPYAYTQGYPSSGGPSQGPAGGGGASASPYGNNGRTGGAGKASDIIIPPGYGTPGPDASLRYFSGGGGGSGWPGGSPGVGGVGGGGTASGGGSSTPGNPGTANTGGGGGAGGQNGGTSGAGGSGIVIVKIRP